MTTMNMHDGYIEPKPPSVGPTLIPHIPWSETTPIPKTEGYAFITVTPAIAAEWLKVNHDRNRNPRERRVEEYTRSLKDGLWLRTPESIQFDTNGTLINGQNRLTAITRSNKEAVIMVAFGQDPENFKVIDTGATRNVPNTLHMRGYGKDSSAVGAAMKGVYAYRDTKGSITKWTGLASLAPIEADEMEKENPGRWMDSVRAGHEVYTALGQSVGQKVWATCYYLFEEHQPGSGRDFFDEVQKVDLTTAPGKLAHGMNRRKLKSFGTLRDPYMVIIRAYNAWLKGDTTFTTAVAPGHKMPLIGR